MTTDRVDGMGRVDRVLIFFAKAIQDIYWRDRRGYVNVWIDKIKDHFNQFYNYNSWRIIDIDIIDIGEDSDVWKRIREDDNTMSTMSTIPTSIHDHNNDNIIYGGRWRDWNYLYEAEKKYFFPLIDSCDILVAAEAWNHPRRGKYTAKVIVDMEYAIKIGKPVYGINIDKWTIKELKKEDIETIRREKEDEIEFVKFLERNL